MASAAAEEESLFFEDDDLLEIHFDVPPSVNRSTNARNIHLPRPQPSSSRSSRSRAQQAQQEHIRDHIPRLQSIRQERQQQQQQQQEAPVIDLTAEPDSPDQPRRSTSHTQGGRNPRRTNSQRISPPRLARSDSTFMAQASSFIDLTADSPEEERPADRLRNRGVQHPPRGPRPDELIDIEFIQSVPRRGVPRRGVPSFAIGLGRRLAGIFSADIITNFAQPNLDVSRTAFARRESPKPPMEPVPPTREGFTRDTCAEPEKESENVVICPACSEELAYDPAGTVVQSTTGSGKKRKRAPGEHHFWALKKCGHVYCADCFENRRPTKTNQSGFRTNGQSTSVNELRCAVDDCDTKIAAKGEWVGIYL
ncbi:Fc.00g001230.m01.CDS01 [Cosmosporella sp. VM-42]